MTLIGDTTVCRPRYFVTEKSPKKPLSKSDHRLTLYINRQNRYSMSSRAASQQAYKIKADADRLFTSAKTFDRSGDSEKARNSYILACRKFGELLDCPTSSPQFRELAQKAMPAILERINFFQREVFHSAELNLSAVLSMNRPESPRNRLGTESLRFAHAEDAKRMEAINKQQQPVNQQQEYDYMRAQKIELDLQRRQESVARQERFLESQRQQQAIAQQQQMLENQMKGQELARRQQAIDEMQKLQDAGRLNKMKKKAREEEEKRIAEVNRLEQAAKEREMQQDLAKQATEIEDQKRRQDMLMQQQALDELQRDQDRQRQEQLLDAQRQQKELQRQQEELDEERKRQAQRQLEDDLRHQELERQEEMLRKKMEELEERERKQARLEKESKKAARERERSLKQEKKKLEAQRKEQDRREEELERQKQEQDRQKQKLDEQMKREEDRKVKSMEATLSDHVVKIKEYQKLKNLGRGSFGHVYCAKRTSTGELVAVKILNTEFTSPDEQVAFLREVESLARANHPAVLRFKGFSLRVAEDEPCPAILTEYLPNGSLQDLLDRKKKFNATQKMMALYGTAEAMRYLHDELSMVHRDLKPPNVMLNANNEPIVGEFGLSKLMTQTLMRQSMCSGSPVYMAPELMDRKDYTNKVDVYSYGVMTYELVTGLLAYDDVNSIQTLVAKVVNGVRPRFPKGVNPAYKELIVQCWDADPNERPSFAQICTYFKEGRFATPECDMEKFQEYVRKLESK